MRSQFNAKLNNNEFWQSLHRGIESLLEKEDHLIEILSERGVLEQFKMVDVCSEIPKSSKGAPDESRQFFYHIDDLTVK